MSMPIVTPQMFGAKADGITDDYAAIMAAITYAETGIGSYWSGGAVHFPDGKYRVSQTIELKTVPRLFGNYSGLRYSGAAELLFDADVMGIVINRSNTLNGAIVSPPTTGADGTTIEGLKIVGSGTDTTKHGIWLRAHALIRNCLIEKFPGNNINIVATVEGGDTTQGNANLWRVEGCEVRNAGLNGLYVDLNDANAGVGIAISAVLNGRWGIWDSSFLGNTYIGCHCASNGTGTSGNNGGKSSYVSFGGIRYAARVQASEAQLVSTEPGTNEMVWKQKGTGGPGGTIPEWVPGQPVGTYFAGGAYRADNLNARNVFLGCYAESGQAGNSFIGPTMVLGGLIESAGFLDGGAITGYNGNGLKLKGTDEPAIEINGNKNNLVIGGHPDFLIAWSNVAETNQWRLQRYGSGDAAFVNSGAARPAILFTGESTTQAMGMSAPIPYMAVLPVLGIGDGTNIRRQTTGIAPPTTGNWAVGDIVWNVSSALGSSRVGWRCITAGAPGTWVPFGTADAMQTISTDADFSLTAMSPKHTLHNGTLTQDRTVTLSTTNAFTGQTWRITRTGADAFNLSIGTLKALATNTWCDIVYDGTAWQLAAYGSL